jgi:hypothetical protein
VTFIAGTSPAAAYCVFAIYKIINLKKKIEKCVVSFKYAPLRNAVHMPKEKRLRTRYREITANRR